MGFYVRKSLRAGPFRMTLSPSGINVSAGIPGFRVGAGPRGNYISIRTGSVHYRTTLRGGHTPGQPATPAPPLARPISDVVMVDTTGADAAALMPTGPGELVEQLNAASRRPLLWPWAALAVLVMAIVCAAIPALEAIVVVLGAVGVAWLGLSERAKRTVIAFYDVTGPTEAWFDALTNGWQSLAALDGAWRIASSGTIRTTHQYKVNSGASALVSRSPVRFTLGNPSALTTNIQVPSISCGRDSLHLLPDRLLVKSGKAWSDVAYPQLQVAASAQRFIESGRVPRDGKQVDTTWQYVNVKGGPDRRYKNNQRLPVMLYGHLELTSPTGLRWSIDCSQPPVADWFNAILAKRQ